MGIAAVGWAESQSAFGPGGSVMKRLFLGFGSIILTLSMLSPALAQVDLGRYTATGSVEAGAFLNPAPNTDAAKYQEYRDLAQQLIVPQVRLLMGDKDGDYYARFDAVNASQKNQMFMLRFGEYGKLDVQLQWLEIPHFFSDGRARTVYDENGGNFTLSSRPATPVDTSGHNVRDWLNSNAKPFDMSLLEGIANVNVRYTPSPYLTFSANLNFQNPTGQQAFGGSFLFGATPSAHINELWVPTQYYTYNFGTGVEYARNGWLFGLQYQGSFFQDVNDTLTWDNPTTWGEMTGPGGSCVDHPTDVDPSGSGKTFKPGGLGPCTGRAAMYPSNQAHNFIATGAGQLPFNTRVMGSIEYGFWLQDAPFIPFTSNTSIVDPFTHKAQQLPRTSLGGDVRPFFANFTIDSNPTERLDLKATYSYMDYDNQTPRITFGTKKDPVLSLNDVKTSWIATANPFAFSVQDINFEPTYRITDNLAAHFIARLTTNHNGGLEVLQQNQFAYGPALDWNPYPWLSMRADYQHAHRDSPGYNNNRADLVRQAAGDPAAGELVELAEMRRFDEATVDVNQTSLYAQVMPFGAQQEEASFRNLVLYGAFDYSDYNYPASDFGLQHTSTYTPSVGGSYDPLPGVHFFSDYSWQAYDWNKQSFAENTVLGNPFSPKNINNIWTTVGRNQGNSIDFGLDIVIPENRYLRHASHLKGQYTYTIGNSLTHNSGETGLPPSGLKSAINYPDTGTRLDEVILQYEYELRKNASINIGYYYCHYNEHDFNVDTTSLWKQTPVPPGSTATSLSTFLGNTTISPYDANAIYISFKYKF
jgi:hypothetical protein